MEALTRLHRAYLSKPGFRKKKDTKQQEKKKQKNRPKSGRLQAPRCTPRGPLLVPGMCFISVSQTIKMNVRQLMSEKPRHKLAEGSFICHWSQPKPAMSPGKADTDPGAYLEVEWADSLGKQRLFLGRHQRECFQMEPCLGEQVRLASECCWGRFCRAGG